MTLPPASVKIHIRGVSKTFRGKKGLVPVLQDVHLEVREREFVAIVGPSGCGKTTLLNCIAGFEPFDAGTIEIDGEPVREPSKKRVFVFQEPGIFPWLSVWDNIGFGLPRRAQADHRGEIVARYVGFGGLGCFEKAYPGQR